MKTEWVTASAFHLSFLALSADVLPWIHAAYKITGYKYIKYDLGTPAMVLGEQGTSV